MPKPSKDQVEEIFDDSPQSKEDDEDKSGDTSTPAEEQLYTLPDGREVTGEQVLEEYKNLQRDYTDKSQKLADFEKEKALQPKDEEAAFQELRQDPNYKNLVRVLKEDGLLTKESLVENFPALYQREQEVGALKKDLTDLDKEIGEKKLPKVNRIELLDFMARSDYRNPFRAYEEMKDVDLSETVSKESAKPSFTEKSGKTGLELPKGERVSFDDGSFERAANQYLETKEQAVE